MSRGPGQLQLYVVGMIRRHGKPMTFADIRVEILRGTDAPPGAELRPSVVRSLRRALHRLAKDGVLMAIGDGGRGDPFRYFINPLIIGMMGDTPEARALQDTLEADP